MGRLSQWAQVGGGRVGAGLLGVARTGDDHGYGRVVDDPPQRELGHGGWRVAYQGSQPANRGERGVVVDAGERLTDVERRRFRRKTASFGVTSFVSKVAPWSC